MRSAVMLTGNVAIQASKNWSTGPVRSMRPQFLAVMGHQADAGLTGDLEILAGDTTDEIDAW